MKIVIGTEEIKEAIECYLRQQGLGVNQYNIDMKIIAGRVDESRIEIDLFKKEIEPEIEKSNNSDENPNQGTLPFTS